MLMLVQDAALAGLTSALKRVAEASLDGDVFKQNILNNPELSF